MEKAIVERVTEVSVDIRMHGRYIADAKMAKHISVDDLGVGYTVLVTEAAGAFYIVGIVESVAIPGSEKGAAWRPRSPVSLSSVQTGSVFTLTWDWGDTVSRYVRLKNYELDIRLSGCDWGIGEFPINAGSAESFRFDVSPYGKTPLQFRVRAVSTDGISSEWATSAVVPYVLDMTAPAAPTNFVASSGYGQISFSWTPPADADLAGYIIYKATSISGSGASVYSSVLLVSSASVPETPGESGFFNIKAIDDEGNLSDYALSDWDFALSSFEGAGQILTNADLEIGDVSADTIRDWDYSEHIDSGSPIMDYQATGGVFNGKSVIAGTIAPAQQGYVTLTWPDPITAIKVPGVPGAAYVISAYVKETGSEETNITMFIGSHDGSSNTSFLSDSTTVLSGVHELADGWKRYWYVMVWDGTYDYIAVQLRLITYYLTGLSSATLDRPMLEVGLTPSEWELYAAPVGDTTGTIGLRIDTTGIVGDNIIIDMDGKFESGIVFADDDTYDIGSDTVRPKDIYVAGDLDIEGVMKLQRSSTEYEVSHPVWLPTPYTNTSFDGDSFSTVSGNTIISRTSWSTAIPVEAKALDLRIMCRDSGSAGTTDLFFVVRPTSTATVGPVACRLYEITNNQFADAYGTVPCTNGDIWYICNASGTNTLDVWIWCFGFWI